MITVTVDKEKGAYRGFCSKGHAGSGRYGQDIVCAAVSVLVINTVNSLEAFTEDDFSLEEEDGFVRLSFKESLSGGGQLLMDSLVLGLTQIAQDYGIKYLQVNVREVF